MNHPNIDTLAIHAGQVADPATNARAVPIYQTTSYTFNDTEHAANLFALKEFGNIYSRIMNPTVDVLEKRLAALHGGTGALATASGMAAIFYTVFMTTGAGNNIVSSTNLYGGTITLFSHTIKRLGMEAKIADSTDPAAIEAAIDDKTRMVYIESIGNPRSNIDDFQAIADIAHKHGLPLVVDNTVTPPPIFNPFDYGADIIVASLTKMIGGHGTSIGGAIIENGKFDYKASGKFEYLTNDDPSYHGVNFWDAFGSHDKAVVPGIAFTLKARCCALRDMGAAMSPFNAFLFLQGLETLPLRARVHCENAQKVAEYLEGHEMVSWVNYPGLASHPNHERAKQCFKPAPGAIFGFGIKGGLEAGKKFINSVKLCSHLANVLDAKTLVIHPASTTHQQLTPEEQQKAGVSEDFVRISVGLEDVNDITADLDQALQAAK